MKLKTPRAKKKIIPAVKPKIWRELLRAPILFLLLLGTTNGDDKEIVEIQPEFNKNVPFLNSTVFSNEHNHRHNHQGSISVTRVEKEILSDIKYLRKHLNREIVNFVMSDVLMDGEVENRLHFDGITAKETYVGAESKGLKLRQLTDGSHFVQIVYNQNGVIQDCEFINQHKAARNFLKTIRKELKLALDEENYRILQRERENFGEDIFFRTFRNVSFRLLRRKDDLPLEVREWLNFDNLKVECLKRHEELKHMVENRNKVGEESLSRYRRSLRENFIMPGTKWCGAGQLAERYEELGPDRLEDSCCRSHDNCRVNIGAFSRQFGYFNMRPYTISHCRCDRRFRACLKLADTSVSNMVGKIFFNVVQTKCFVLKPVKMCTKRSWWGKCLQRGFMKQAYLRGNLPY